MSEAEALIAGAKKADVRHEYLRGEVFAMAGGTPEHAALAAAVIHEGAIEAVGAVRVPGSPQGPASFLASPGTRPRG